MKFNIGSKCFSLLMLHALIFCFISANAQVYHGFNHKYPAKELQQDLRILREGFLKIHPGVFWYQDSLSFEKTYQSDYSSLTTESNLNDFAKIILPFVAQIRCGHTSLDLPAPMWNYVIDSTLWFPFSIKIIKERVYIFKNFSNDSLIPVGTEITSINGESIPKILASMRNYMSAESDGQNNTAVFTGIQERFGIFINFINNYKWSVYDLNLVEPFGKTKSMLVNGIPHKQMIANEKVRYPLSVNAEEDPFHYTVIDSLNTEVMTINAFNHLAIYDADTTHKKIENYKTFLKDHFTQIQSKNIKHLIIDLRNNGGGTGEAYLYSFLALKPFQWIKNIELTLNPKDTIFKYGSIDQDWVLQCYNHNELNQISERKYLIKGWDDDSHTMPMDLVSHKPLQPNKPIFKGDVYILTSNKTFSAASDFASIAQFNKRAKIIGQEAGGGAAGNTSGGFFSLKLPNTGFVVYIPVAKCELAVKNNELGRGVMPDMEVTPTIDDLLSKKDLELNAALKMISSKK